jgi:hypothetical protein
MAPANNALERSVKGLAMGAAGARTIVAPAARWPRLARPAQRGRWTALGKEIGNAPR